MLIRKPFTLDDARARTDRSLWNDPAFPRTNLILTSVWGTIFTLDALLAFGKMQSILLQSWQDETINDVLLVGGAILTTWYPKRVRTRAVRTAPERGSEDRAH